MKHPLYTLCLTLAAESLDAMIAVFHASADAKMVATFDHADVVRTAHGALTTAFARYETQPDVVERVAESLRGSAANFANMATTATSEDRAAALRTLAAGALYALTRVETIFQDPPQPDGRPSFSPHNRAYVVTGDTSLVAPKPPPASVRIVDVTHPMTGQPPTLTIPGEG